MNTSANGLDTVVHIYNVYKTYLLQELRKEISRQKESLQGAVGELKADILEMERKLERAGEQERLLVEYPDLNGPVNTDLAGKWNKLLVFVNCFGVAQYFAIFWVCFIILSSLVAS